MNNGQVSLYTGEGVKANLSKENDITETHPRFSDHIIVSDNAADVRDARDPVDHLYGGQVVGEDVGVTRSFEGALTTPSLVTQGEDEDTERVEEDDLCDAEGNGDDHWHFGVYAVVGRVDGHLDWLLLWRKWRREMN